MVDGQSTPDMQQMVAVGLETLADDSGNKLVTEVAAALQECEDHCQQFMAKHEGETPVKPYEVTVKLEVLATGVYGRAVTWKVEKKLPATAKSRTTIARSKDGCLTMFAAPEQKRLLFREAALPDDEARERETASVEK